MIDLLIATVVLAVVVCLSYTFDLVYINNSSFRSRFESNKLVTILSASAVKALESGASNPSVHYISKRLSGLIALILCASLIYFYIFYM